MNLKIAFLLLCIEMNSKLEKTLRKERQLKDVTVASYKSTFNTMARRYGVNYLSATWAKKNLDQIIEDLSGSSHSHKVSRCSVILLLFSPKQRRAPSSKFRHRLPPCQRVAAKDQRGIRHAEAEAAKDGEGDRELVGVDRHTEVFRKVAKSRAVRFEAQRRTAVHRRLCRVTATAGLGALRASAASQARLRGHESY